MTDARRDCADCVGHVFLRGADCFFESQSFSEIGGDRGGERAAGAVHFADIDVVSSKLREDSVFV